MRPSEGERRGRFPSGKVSLFEPLDPLDPLPPRGQGEPRGRKGVQKAEKRMNTVRISTSLIHSPPEQVQSCVFTAVRRSLSGRSSCSLSCVVLVSRIQSFTACLYAVRFPVCSGSSRLLRCSVPTISHKTDPSGPLTPEEYPKITQKKRFLQAYRAFLVMRNGYVLVIFGNRKGRRF